MIVESKVHLCESPSMHNIIVGGGTLTFFFLLIKIY